MIRLLLRGLLEEVLVPAMGLFGYAAEEKKAPAKLTPEKKTVRAAYVTTSGAMVELWTAVEKGYFEEYDLTVEPVLTRNAYGFWDTSTSFRRRAICVPPCTQVMIREKANSWLDLKKLRWREL